MQELKQRLHLFRRKKLHIKILKNIIIELKYEILNNALKNKEVNSIKVDLLHKYNRRIKLITFLRNG